MFDLDGVVYVSGRAIDGVAERLQRVRDAGVHLAFVTNNASRTPEKVAANLVKLGVAATAADVVTSAQAAARVIKERFGPGATVLLLGGAGLQAALAAEGLVVTEEPSEAAAIVSGYGPDVLWKDIMRAATLIRDGLPYVASNTDMTIPTDYGLAPGSRGAGADPVGVRRGRADRGRQAGAAVDGRDHPPGRGRPSADGGRSTRHRHRGSARGRRRLACS